MTWPGAQLFRSKDGGSTYEPLFTETTAASIGTLTAILPNFTQGNIVDEGSVGTVNMISGPALTSITETQLLNGMNLAAIGQHGRWEIVQFRNATLTAANTYQLSGFLRGRRGSEWACGVHQVNDRFVLVSIDAWNRVNDSDVGLPRVYKAPPFRVALSSVAPRTFTNTAVALMPFAPVDLAGSRDSSNNLTLAWNRRTRLAANTLNLPAPLGEASESYSIDIIKAGAVVRTIASSTPSVVYSAANQTTDGITPGAAVTVRIYMLSATVGRGYPLQGIA